MKGACLWLLLGLIACGPAPRPPATESAPVADGEVLAVVGGEPIHAEDLRLELHKLLGEQALLVDLASVESQVLEALVASRAIAQQRARELGPDRLAEIERQATAFRDQLLVQDYLAAHAQSSPVTEAEARAYYAAHPENFGAATVKEYEALWMRAGLDETHRDRVLQRLGAAADAGDWQRFARANEQWLEYGRGRSDAPSIPRPLADTLASMPEDPQGQMQMLEARPLRLRVTATRALEPQPFEMVRDDIRRALAAQRMRDSLRALSAQVLATTTVEYAEEAPRP